LTVLVYQTPCITVTSHAVCEATVWRMENSWLCRRSLFLCRRFTGTV